MRLSVDLGNVRKKLGLYPAIELIAAAGFDALDFSFCGFEDAPELADDGYLEEAKRIRAFLDQNHIACNQAHAPFKLTCDDRYDLSEKKFAQIVRAMEVASILGAERIIVHAVKMPFECLNDREYFMQHQYEYFMLLKPYCQKFGIQIAIENVYRTDKKRKTFKGDFQTPEEMCQIIDRLGREDFCICIDVGHTSLVGYEPEEFIGKMKRGYVGALHVHDTDYQGDRHVLPYTSQLNWERITAALKAIGYDGDFTFEILSFISRFPNELLGDTLCFANKVGRHLISLIEN